jgi:hypothetical protein
MKARAIIMLDGQVQIFVDEGTFEEASAKARSMLQALGAVDADEPEQHRHGLDEVHVREHVHA